MYDKLRNREVFYRNDVIKPAAYNPRLSWAQSGLELTGPHDLHMLTLHGEPFWANQVVEHEDGSVSLVLGETDPVYGMKVNLSATLHPGVAALEIGVSCYNGREARMPQMLWMNGDIGDAEDAIHLSDEPDGGSYDRRHRGLALVQRGLVTALGPQQQTHAGGFRDRHLRQLPGRIPVRSRLRHLPVCGPADRAGMKLWTFGYGEGAKNHERGYTDNAGPYVELQSGRHVWDGHYEWVSAQNGRMDRVVDSGGATGGLTTLSRDIALKLDTETNRGCVGVAIAATRALPELEQVEILGGWRVRFGERWI